MPFYNGQSSAAPGVTKLSTTSITLATTVADTSLTLIPGTGFNLSTTADTAAFDVITDNFTGYSISLSAADNDQTLVNTTNSAYTISSITTPIDQSNFLPTNPTLINHWGIKPNRYYDTTTSTTITNTSTILPAPNTAGTMLDVTNTANSTANNYAIAIGAMVDGSKPSGTYTRAATLTATANPIYYTLNFDKNTTDTVTNLPETQTGSTTATTITIPSTTPERANYEFIGWCKGTTTTTSGVDTCTDGASGTGTVFQPGDDYGIDQTVENTSTLYAMWSIDTVTVTLTAGTGIDTVAITGTGVESGGAAGSTSTATVAYGGEIIITATPTTTYKFDNWTGDTTYTNNPQTIASVTADTALTANATRLPGDSGRICNWSKRRTTG